MFHVYRCITFPQTYSDGASSGAPREGYTGVMAEANTPCASQSIPVFRMMDENGGILPGVKEPTVSPPYIVRIL